MKRAAMMGALVLAGLGLTGCADEYGYGRVGYAYEGGYPGYYNGYYGGGYGPYYGWYSGFYYPGTGIYVYDQYRRPYRWNNVQQRYWQGRLNGYRGGADWRGFAGGGFSRQPGYHGGYGNRGYGGQGYHGGYAPSGGGARGGGWHGHR